jgi:transcriptional regulator with XRE-family HTH domain
VAAGVRILEQVMQSLKLNGIDTIVSAFADLRDRAAKVYPHAAAGRLTMGVRIRNLRKDRGLTLDALAAKSGCSKSYLWELEKRPHNRPSAMKLAAIAQALGVTIDYLRGCVPQAVGEDEAFLRFYQSQPRAMRAKIRAVAKVLGE